MGSSRRHAILAVLLLSCLLCQAQQLLLTRDGLRSSTDNSLSYVEYAYRNFTQRQMKDYCTERLSGLNFVKYEIKRIDDNTIDICGFMDGSCFLVFGKTEIAFCMRLQLDAKSVKVSVELTKSSGRPLNYGLLFSKNGKVRFAPTKNRIEDEIKDLINNVFESTIVIK